MNMPCAAGWVPAFRGFRWEIWACPEKSVYLQAGSCMRTEVPGRKARHKNFSMETMHKRYRGPVGVLMCIVAAFLSSFLTASCGKEHPSFSPEERAAAERTVRAVRGADSLALLQESLEGGGDRLGSIVALREWGKELRNESRFDEALSVHSKGLRQAEAAADTLEWVRALNNVGTDYRRMGVLDVALEYHYSAWKLSEECTDTSSAARKNRVVSLNGLGNVYMTLGDYGRADSVLRTALDGERELGSALGMAINYANIGFIFEHRGQIDSAWTCYRRSMAFNREAGSELGIALCHTYFGSLYEKAGQYGRAAQEYEAAHGMMEASKDEWHALNTLVALAGIHLARDDGAKALEYLAEARETAGRIRSYEHLEEIWLLYYSYYTSSGDYREALSCHEEAAALRDSVLDVEKLGRIQDTGLRIERNRQARQMDEIRLRLKQEQTLRRTGYGVSGLVVFFFACLSAVMVYVRRIRDRSYRALKQAIGMREHFFTNVTHEFRTPLTVILGLCRDMQRDVALTAETKDRARTIERQGNELLALVNQLLDISKIKSEVGDPDWRNGDIATHIDMVVAGWREYARSRDIDLQFLSKEVGEMDFVPDYVTKTLNNLLSNAFKFTPEYGRVSVVVWRRGDRLLIDVSDTGEGMDGETLAHLFEPFYQAGGGAGHPGSGIGLALVKQIVDAVEGQIEVESSPGMGTAFHISVPVRNKVRQRYAMAAAPETPVPPQPGTGPDDGDGGFCRLLVIEDNHDIAAYIGAQFGGRYSVSYASNGREGLERALELVPDLIITDLMMPGMDGLELCRQIRGNEILDHIPIVVVTARITGEDRIKGIEAGADAYLEKPFSSDELRTQVESLLDRHRRLRDKFSGLPDADGEEEALSDVERRFINRMVDFTYLLLDKRRLEVDTLAEKLCMSPRQLHRKVVALTGDTPASFMLKVKMQRARHLLKADPGLTIEEVADRCGFGHTSSFYHAFRRMYGITPAEYRRRG